MTFSRAGITLLLVAASTLAAPEPVLTQTCGQMLGNVLDRISTLNNEARADNLNFLRDDVAETVGKAAKRRLEAAGDPTVEAYNHVQEAREKVEAWAARVDSMDGFFTRLRACLAPGSGCKLMEFHKLEMQRMKVVEAVREQLNEWVQSLGDGGITAAAERVNKASALVSNVFTGAQGVAQSSITNAVQCMDRYVRDAQTTRADQIDPGVTAPSATPPPPSSGGGIGKALGMTALLGGAAVAGLWAASAVSDLEDYGSVTTPTGSPVTVTSPSTTNPTSNDAANYRYGNWNCGASTQCAAVFGSVTGSIGPICTQALCEQFLRQGGNSTCTVQPVYTPVRNGPAPGTPCINR